MIKDVWPEGSRVESLRRCVRKDADTSDMADLIVLWRSICFHVFTNWFLRTEAANYDTRVSSALVGPPPRNLFAIPVCLRNVPNLYQFPDCLFAVVLAMPLKESRLPLAIISRRLFDLALYRCLNMIYCIYFNYIY